MWRTDQQGNRTLLGEGGCGKVWPAYHIALHCASSGVSVALWLYFVPSDQLSSLLFWTEVLMNAAVLCNDVVVTHLPVCRCTWQSGTTRRLQ